MRILAGMLAGFLVLIAFWHIAGNFLVDHFDGYEPRDELTGVLIGAEARQLGPPESPRAVLFVHGFAGSGNNFAELPELMAKDGWFVRVLRLPGHGTSPRDYESTTNEQLIGAVEDAVKELKGAHRTVAIVTHSMGASLATIVAAREPVDALVLGAPYFGITHRWYYGLKPETWEKVASPFVRWVYKGNLFRRINRRENTGKIVDYPMLPMRSIVRLHALAERANEPAVLKRITMPVLMLLAPGDMAASPEAAEHAFEQMPSVDKRVVRLERSNHHIYWDYDQQQVYDEVEKFLNGVVPAE